MKTKLFLATLATVFLASAASAADLPLKAPSVSATATPWSGFYLGGGIGFQASNTGETLDSLSLGSQGTRTPAQVEPALATSEPLNGIAFRTSVYAGYNLQVARQWVLGVEGDLGTADHSTTFAGLAFPDQSLQSFAAADGITARTTWDAGARGRVGFLVAPATLVYASGGAAWQHFEITTKCFVLCTNFETAFGTFSITPALTTNAATKVGWTMGGGLETALGGHWFARADYRFADFGDTTFTIKRNTTFLPFNPIVNTFDVPFRTHTATFGLAYKFGDEVAPSGATSGWVGNTLPMKALPAKAPASSPWNGLYAGFGIGLRAAETVATTTGPNDPTLLAGPNGTPGATSQPLNGTAFRGSPYVGWNWQIAPRWVVGVEGDVGFANQTTSLPGVGFSPAIFPFIDSKNNNFALRTTWDASARGRVGFLSTPATLLYATAGAAWQHFEAISTCGSEPGNTECGGLTPLVVTNSATKVGWTAGLGAETMLGGNWLARGEYRYADFGTSSFTITRNVNLGGSFSSNFDVGLRTHTVTFGVSYKFGGLGGLPIAN